MSTTLKQARWYILTIKSTDWNPSEVLPPGVDYIKGQKEIGESGYEHWQFVAHFAKKIRLSGAKAVFVPSAHVEPTRSEAAIEYCFKEETRVEGTQFEYGKFPLSRKRPADWEQVWTLAKQGKIEDIPPDIRIKQYNVIRKIEKDFMVPPPDIDDVCGIWYYGVPGSGKSFLSRQQYPNAYLKPCNKWWDGYQGQDNVLIDDLDLNHKVLGHHLKIWADKYSFIAENKGSGMCIRPKKIIVTSNYSIYQIFAEDPVLCQALMRRFICTYFENKYLSS